MRFIVRTADENTKYEYSEYVKDIIQEMQNVSENDTRNIKIHISELNKINDGHVIYGLYECLTQSDYCPYFIYEEEDLELEFKN